jgi:pimeloyl-ACP methyl ester carboxylesterase
MLHVRDSGNGSAVLLLHAFPLNSRMWQPQIEALNGRARFLAVDFPGFGLSPPLDGAPSLADYAARVRDLLDQRGIEKLIVVGLSMGGYVSFRLAELLGSRLSGLLLADTRPTPDTEAGVLARHELAAEVEAEGVEVAANEFIPKLIGSTSLRTQPGIVEWVRSVILENSVAGVADALRAMAGRPDSTALLERLACPVVCVVGDEDTITPPDVVQAMASRIPNARVEVIGQAGHLTNLEAPDAFNRVLAGVIGDR